MKKIKSFLIGLLFYAPFGANALAPIIIGALIVIGVGLVGSVGMSVYRTVSPVNMTESLEFFSSCWSCHAFGGLLSSLSMFIPKIYASIGKVMIPIAAGLTIIWFAWKILEDYIKIKPISDAWEITGTFGSHIIKMTIFAFLLSFPLPRFMMNTFIEPIMNIGMAYNHSIRGYISPGDTSFDACIIATTLKDQDFSQDNLYSAKLKNNILCQIAEFHKMTGIGMTAGFTISQMAFNAKYELIPHFLPNLKYVGMGILVLLAFIWALVPIPLYFMEVFARTSLNILMLPFMLLGWIFNKWAIFPSHLNEKSISKIISDVVKDTFGIALTGVFLGFSILFLNSVIGDMDGIPALMKSIQNNDPELLMDALQLKNDTFFELLLMGLFIGMFMNAIPNLIKVLFKSSAPQIEEFQKSAMALGKNAAGFVKDSAKAVWGAVSKSNKT